MDRLILLDWDGTLVDSLPSIVHTSRKFFAELGHPGLEEREVREAIADGRGLEYFLDILHPDASGADMDEWKMRWREIYDAEAHPLTSPYPGALEAMERLRSLGATLAVVSNKGQRALAHAVAAHGFEPLMDLVVGEGPDRPKKPAAELFTEHIAPHFPGLDPARTLMVGDSESDLRFGKALGGTSCFAAYGYGDRERCLAVGPELVADKPAALADLMDRGTDR